MELVAFLLAIAFFVFCVWLLIKISKKLYNVSPGCGGVILVLIFLAVLAECMD